MKKEFQACSVAMDLPTNHPLRTQLSDMKKIFEEVLEEFLSSISISMTCEKKSRVRGIKTL